MFGDPVRPETVRSVEVVQVVRTESGRGRGESPDDPFRLVTQFWSFEGTLLGELDPFLLTKKES